MSRGLVLKWLIVASIPLLIGVSVLAYANWPPLLPLPLSNAGPEPFSVLVAGLVLVAASLVSRAAGATRRHLEPLDAIIKRSDESSVAAKVG